MGRRSQQALALCLKTGTLLVSLSSGYGRNAYAASCIGSGGIYTCGPGIDVTQILSGNPLLVTTLSGFSSDTLTSGGDAFDLFSTSGGITFTDDFGSTITGKEDAIVAVNYGSGNLTITTTGMVSATTGIGIWTDNRSSGTDTEINVAGVTGGDSGIRANNAGNGHLWITATGPVEGISGNGIFAENGGNGTELVISATTVTGGSHGISATNRGSSILSITMTGAVTGGAYGIGILANNYGTDLRITATSVTGGDKGILATNNGTGSLAITTSGEVSSTGNGLLAFGIYAINRGNGSLSITAQDTVSSLGSGGYALGIYANNSVNGTSLSISATDVKGGYAGIYANNFGSGVLSITTSGSVEATRDKAIVASTGAYSSDLTIYAAGVKGSSDAIAATSNGSGSLFISVSGAVEGTGGYGIIAQNDGGGPTTINVGRNASVQGGLAGITVGTTTGQSTTINVAGQVTNLNGLSTASAIISSDSATTVNLLAGSVTTGVIYLSDFSDFMTLAGTLDGSVSMYGGNDTFVQTGGSTLTGTADGGAGTDTLGFNNMGTVQSGKYVNFENLAVYGGSTTLAGNWDFSTGQVTLYSGDLAIAGTLSASLLTVCGSGTLVDNGRLYIGTLNIQAGGAADIFGSATVDGSTTVSGSLTIEPGGTFTTERVTVVSGGIAAISGTADVNGTTDIFGSLWLDGTLTTTQLTVEHGGLLGGDGTVNGDVTVTGTVSPGHSIRTLSVNGSLGFQPGSSYIAELAADGSSDLIRVNGPVSISGGTLVAYLPIALYADGDSWEIITATGGITGVFSSIKSNVTSYTISLDQQVNGHALDLVISRTPYATFGETTNQEAVGSALDAILPDAQGSMAALFLAMDFAMDPGQLTSTLQGLNPEMYCAFPAAGLEITSIFSRMVGKRQQEGIPAATNSDQLWDVWGEVLGHRLDQDTDDDVAGYQADSEATIIGMDRAIGQTARAGLVLGYSSSDLSFHESESSGQIVGKYIGIYGSTGFDDFYLNGSAGYTSLDNSATRVWTTPVFSGKTASSFNSDVIVGSVSGGYDFFFGKLRVGPTVSLAYQYLDQDHFSEKGVQDFTLRVQNDQAQSLTSSIGGRITRTIESGSWRFLPHTEIELIHQFLDESASLTCNFADYPEATFTVDGAEPDANGLQARLGLTAEYESSLSIALNISTIHTEHRSSSLFSGGLTWTF